MNQLDSYILLLIALIAAYIFSEFLNFLNTCNVNFQKKQFIKAQKNDDLFKHKCQFLFNCAMDHYYTLAINSPEIIANELAEHHISELKQANKISEIYSILKKRGT